MMLNKLFSYFIFEDSLDFILFVKSIKVKQIKKNNFNINRSNKNESGESLLLKKNILCFFLSNLIF
jgi:hypothetical protein